MSEENIDHKIAALERRLDQLEHSVAILEDCAELEKQRSTQSTDVNPGSGWRLLHHGEQIMPGDEYMPWNTRSWCKSQCFDCKIGDVELQGYSYRRRVEKPAPQPDGFNAWWEKDVSSELLCDDPYVIAQDAWNACAASIKAKHDEELFRAFVAGWLSGASKGDWQTVHQAEERARELLAAGTLGKP